MGEKPFHTSVHKILLKSQSLPLTFSDIKELVTISRIIISSHLKYTKPGIIRLCNEEGITVDDLAIDSIAELFALDESERYYHLDNLVLNLRESLNDLPTIEVYLAFKALLIKISDIQIARQYAQVDPNGFKIQRNIKEYINSSHVLKIQYSILGPLITILEIDNKDSILPYYDYNELRKDFDAAYKGKPSIPNLVNTVITILTQQISFRKELLLSDCVSLCKSFFELDNDSMNDASLHDSISVTHIADEFEIEQIKSKVLSIIKEKIVMHYYAKSKISKNDADLFYCVMVDIIDDWINKGEKESTLPHYIKRYRSITIEEFNTIFKSKFEYLIKIARREFEILLEINN